MNSRFVDQIYSIMYMQHSKNCQRIPSADLGNNYKWLSGRRPTITWMSSRDEFMIRQELKKLDDEQKVKVINELLKWIEISPMVSSSEVPEKCIKLLSSAVNSEAVAAATMSRMSSFRNSLRRTVLPKKVAPLKVELNPMIHNPTRSVTFNDNPTVYSINC